MSNRVPVNKKLFLYDYLLFTAFIVLSAIGLFFHEMSETEMQNWVVAKESQSLQDLWHNMRYEPHPYLWHTILYFGSKIYPHFWVAQLLHLFFNATAVFLILRYSPFQKKYIWVFAFGYFPFFEYNLITRNYALCFLCIVLVILAFKHRHNGYIALFGVSGLLANVHVYGLVMSIMIVVITCVDFWLERKKLKPFEQRRFFIGLFCYLLILGATIYYTRLPEDSILQLNTLSFSVGRIAEAALGIWKSMVPIPAFLTTGFWNSNVIADLSPPFFTVVSILMYIFLMSCLYKKPIALTLFVMSSSAFLVLFFVSRTNEMRHFGFFFLSFFSALWVSTFYQDSNLLTSIRPVQWIAERTDRVKKSLLILLLVIHLFCGSLFYLEDLINPFSQAKHVVQYLKDRGMVNQFIAVDRYHTIPSVTGYLQSSVYSFTTKKHESFLVWDVSKGKVLSPEELIERVDQLSTERSMDMVLILNYKFELPKDMLTSHPHLKMNLIQTFEGSMCRYEDFYVYTIAKQ